MKNNIVIGGNKGLKMSFYPDLSRPLVKNARTRAQRDLIERHYKYLETYSKVVPHAWIAIIDVKDLT